MFAKTNLLKGLKLMILDKKMSFWQKNLMLVDTPHPLGLISLCTPPARLCLGHWSGANHENRAPVYGFQIDVAFGCLVLHQIWTCQSANPISFASFVNSWACKKSLLSFWKPNNFTEKLFTQSKPKMFKTNFIRMKRKFNFLSNLQCAQENSLG